MKTAELLQRIAEISPKEGPQIPPIELVAMVVRVARKLRQWKKETLADFACVSLSTVERVERGEKVHEESLDRIAQALGYEPGAFTAPRVRLSHEEMLTHLEEMSYIETVPVRRLRTQPQVRAIAQCYSRLIHRPEIGSAYDEQISELNDWFDIASPSLDSISGSIDDGRRRELYADVLAAVQCLEQRGVTVLVGIVNTPKPDIPEWKVALISITPKLSDPGALKRRVMFVDRRCLRWP